MPDDESDLLTPSQVAALFAVTPQTVSRWAAAGRLPSVLTAGGHRRFLRVDIEQARQGAEEPQA